MKIFSLPLLASILLFGCATTGPSLEVGDMAPEFSLVDVSGKEVRLSDFRDKKHVVLIFYTGYSHSNYTWPVCLDQLGELQRKSTEIKNLDSEIIGISTMGDPEDVKQVERSYGITFTLVPKPNRKIAEEFGVWNRQRNYAVAAVIVDKKGRLRFRENSDDDRYRTSASRIIRELQGISATN